MVDFPAVYLFGSGSLRSPRTRTEVPKCCSVPVESLDRMFVGGKGVDMYIDIYIYIVPSCKCM